MERINQLSERKEINYFAVQLGNNIDIVMLRKETRFRVVSFSVSDIMFEAEHGGYIHIFKQGGAVFVNCSEHERLRFIEVVMPYVSEPQTEKFIDDFVVELEPEKPARFQFDYFSLPVVNTDVHKVVAINMVQSTSLDYYSEVVSKLLDQINEFSVQLELKGKLKLGRKSMLKFIGRSLNSKNAIAQQIYFFDTPDIAWDDQYLDRLNRELNNNFELKQRYRVLETKFKILEENLSVYMDIYNQKESALLEWIIIILILVEVIDTFVGKIL
ncbi:RMD1 family protein [Marinigracilibium pacificum]|uniref:RMD1 family protein n=1 Tax=Marinigracilibium pacificum TaxID=2729599 RepID=A0A848IUT9_9BACT|nr:RMD1 family protein [Marinigracilibium pacificum]NMM47456.1 RMD1 family protein [Marinigracilibium pacificum]